MDKSMNIAGHASDVSGEKPSVFVIEASEWINSPPILFDRRNVRLTVVSVFQMLCPACVIHTIPQIQKARHLFERQGVQFIGLHSVFEHHRSMTSEHLRVFLSEFRVDFPVAVDARTGQERLPLTMERYGFQGTPTTLLVDASGRLLLHHFGAQSDMEFAANIQKYL